MQHLGVLIGLDEIKLIKVAQGGYEIKAHISSEIPANATYYLQVSALPNASTWESGSPITRMQVHLPVPAKVLHGHPKSHRVRDVSLMNFQILPDFLELIRRNHLWGRPAYLQVMATIHHQQPHFTGYFTSKAQQFRAPVEPVSRCDHTLAKDITLKYPPHQGEGRMLFNTGGFSDIRGRYYFVNAGQFETSNVYRGFDCTSFLKAALQLRSDLGGILTGEAIAAHKGAIRLLRKQKRDKLIEFIEQSPLVYSRCIILIHRGSSEETHHCVLQVNGTVYEFNTLAACAQAGLQPGNSFGGYVTPLDDWRKLDEKSLYSVYGWGAADFSRPRTTATTAYA